MQITFTYLHVTQKDFPEDGQKYLCKKKQRFEHILMVAFSVLLTTWQTINNRYDKTTIKLQVPQN
jgi:hypothetical protein